MLIQVCKRVGQFVKFLKNKLHEGEADLAKERVGKDEGKMHLFSEIPEVRFAKPSFFIYLKSPFVWYYKLINFELNLPFYLQYSLTMLSYILISQPLVYLGYRYGWL